MFEKLLRMIIMGRILKKIVKKVLLIPGVKWWFDGITELYGIARIEIEKELDMLNNKYKVSVMNFKHYLPDTGERIKRLRRVINKRPVAIILHGHSVTELEEKITELEDCDICYFGVNAFTIPEKHILQKINHNLSVIMRAAPLGAQMNDIIDFLERQEEDNIFISERASFHPREMSQGFDLDKFIKKYDRKLLFYIRPAITFITIRNELFIRHPSIEYPLHLPGVNSFGILLSLAVIGEAPMVVVFGGDGGRINGRELYFRECGLSDSEQIQEQYLKGDTRLFNAAMPFILEKIYKIYNLRPVDIINCSMQSHYTPFRKLSYDETFALLKSFKKDAGLTC